MSALGQSLRSFSAFEPTLSAMPPVATKNGAALRMTISAINGHRIVFQRHLNWDSIGVV